MAEGIPLEDAIADFKERYGFSDQAWEIFRQAQEEAHETETALAEAISRADRGERRASVLEGALAESAEAVGHLLEHFSADEDPGPGIRHDLVRWRRALAGDGPAAGTEGVE
jgi:hypothetical protein